MPQGHPPMSGDRFPFFEPHTHKKCQEGILRVMLRGYLIDTKFLDQSARPVFACPHFGLPPTRIKTGRFWVGDPPHSKQAQAGPAKTQETGPGADFPRRNKNDLAPTAPVGKKHPKSWPRSPGSGKLEASGQISQRS